MKRLLLMAMIGCAATLSAPAAQRDTKMAKVNYGRPFEPPTRPAFIPLPPGAVEPDGWLRDWCLTARDGYTGHMDEVDPAFRQAWAADFKMTGEKLFWEQGGWPYEGGAYWFDGLVGLGYILHDDLLINQAKARLDAVVTNMNENGIMFMSWLNRNNPDDVKATERALEWPMWANGLLGRALAYYYAGSGDKQVLRALETAFSGNRRWVRMASSNPWPAFQTYTWTGNKEIKETLTEFFTEGADIKEGDGTEIRDYKVGGSIGSVWSWNKFKRMPDEKPGAERNDHGVTFCEGTSPWALGYLWTGKPEFLKAPVRWHEIIERDSMQPYGVPVFDEYGGPTGAFRGTETCDVAGYMWGQILLLTIGGQGRMGDRVERAFFNAAPACVARDFKTHVYLQSPNRIANLSLPSGGDNPPIRFTYQKTHGPLCCTAVLNRILPNYVMHMWMATYDNGLAATHYGPCKVSALVADHVPAELTCRTDFPFNEIINITVKPAHEATFPLSFRIPGWCENPAIAVNGRAIKSAPDARGFVRVERSWKPGDMVSLQFPMSVRVKVGRDNNDGIARNGITREWRRDNNTNAAPYASVSYGPLLFSLPIPDTTNANTPDPTTKWNYALEAQGRGAKLGADITVERSPMSGKWNWPLESPLKLRAHAVTFDWKPTENQALPSAPVAVSKEVRPEKIILIPYGCTKFRVSMFPVTEQTFKLAAAAD